MLHNYKLKNFFLVLLNYYYIMPRGNKLSDIEIGQIIAFNDQRLTQRAIAEKIGRSQKVISNFLKVGYFRKLSGVMKSNNEIFCRTRKDMV